MKLSQRLGCEFIGTFTLIFAGVSAICSNVGIVGIALAHGLALVVMISALGHISGGHFNPAVSLGAFLGGKLKSSELLPYIVAQLAGAFVGALAVKGIFAADIAGPIHYGTPALATGVSMGTAILAEMIATFFLVTVVYGSAIDSRAPKCGGLFIGLTVTLDILAIGSITGAAMNPARAFGPALAAGMWEFQAVYWIGPLLGGALAGLVYSRWLGNNS
ncbi:MAG: aquaporin [Deltaproteobacteria bacterium]|nr:aquaporin [Deltaproteobacteria bacterium]